MNENIDLTKILKDCPKGTKFYSSIYGEVEFISANSKNDSYQIVLKELRRNSITFVDSKGKYFHEYNGECTLFPSQEQRDWSKFTAPWYKKEIGTIARIEKQGEQAPPQTNERVWLYLVSDVLTWKDGIGQYLDDQRVQELAKKLCSKYAQKLYNPSSTENDELNDAGYEWDVEKKELNKKEKFDPKTLQPFDKILVKRYDDIWVATLLSHYNRTIFTTINNGLYESCIPYNEDTKHLVGTNEEAPEYYRYWED